MKTHLRVITFSINTKMCGKISSLFGLLIAIGIFNSASQGGLYIHAMGDDEYVIIKDWLHKTILRLTHLFQIS